MEKGAQVGITLTVGQWERVLSALSSHDPVVRRLIVTQLQTHADQQARTPMLPQWESGK